MRLVLLGPPGAGKGTHAVILAQQLNAPHISTGDMLREAIKLGNPLGLKAKACMDGGELVPDDIVIAIVAERLKLPDAKKGFILDGFPRTVDQAVSLDKELKVLAMPLDFVLYFKTSLALIIRRLSGRRVCEKCSKVFHLRKMPPKGVCDVCGGALFQRPDDHEDTIEHRLAVYEKQTAPLIEYYSKKGTLAEVDGDLEVEPLNAVLRDLFQKRTHKTAG